MLTLIRRLGADETGQALPEYALIIAVVALGVTAAMIVMREEIIGTFRGASEGMKTTPTGQTN